ncbi:hypothetical protein FRB95_014276 [Tulasnella sp. JGI-2019a]|nr:hypothetical protein FRB93_013228 [Tulasnella sp. JGI-2019a]KAG9022732.1 hypothetical protein FRB95_014276 [Tulasnella sp. JGI-2019a]
MSTVALTPDQLAAMLKEAAYYIRATQMSFVAWYAVTLWDWVTSFPREYRLIHKSQWSVIKVLYLLCRYWPIVTIPFTLWVFIGDHTEAECNKLFRIPEAIAMWNQIFAEAVLVVRTYAFYGNSIRLFVFFCTCLATLAAFQIYVVVAGMTLLPFVSPPTGPCFPSVIHSGSPLIMIFFILPLVFDTMITGFTIVRAIRYRHQVAGGTGSPLINMIVREGLFYFVLISGANLVNGIFYWQPNASMSALNIPLSIMLTDVLACRLILDLRERGKAGSSSSHPVNSNGGQNYSHSARRHLPKGIAPPTRTPAELENNGAITGMDFNHELTTFHGDGRQITVLSTTAKEDENDSLDGDVKAAPYDGSAYPSHDSVETGDRDRSLPPSRGIRIKVETRQHD